jgi:hypothetical protein
MELVNKIREQYYNGKQKKKDMIERALSAVVAV